MTVYDFVVVLIVNWRVGLPLVVSLVLAVVLTRSVSWITGGYGLALVLASFGGGLLWQASAHAKRSAITKGHLEGARALLPTNAVAGPDGGTVREYRHFLEINELEQALDELSDMGLANAVPNEFWRSLQRAAENMGLADHMAKFQQKLEGQ